MKCVPGKIKSKDNLIKQEHTKIYLKNWILLQGPFLLTFSIQNNLQNLEAMKVGSKDRPQSTPEVILKNLKTRFKKEKSDLVSIRTCK